MVSSPNRGTNSNIPSGVSCVSATACVAVGSYLNSGSAFRTLAESWNGTCWSLVASPQPGDGDSLNGVSCTSVTACMAVGGYDFLHGTRTLVESWDGTRWSVVPSPDVGTNGNDLFGVSCASATA